MIKTNLMKKTLLFATTLVVALGTLGVGTAYALDYDKVDMEVTGANKMKLKNEGTIPYTIDIKDGDIWIGDFLEGTIGKTVTASKLKEILLDEDEKGRIMEARVTNTTELSVFDILGGDEDSEKNYDLKFELKNAEGIIHEIGNIKMAGDVASIQNIEFDVNDRIVLKAPTIDETRSNKYYWFKLDTSMKMYSRYDDKGEESLFLTYHVVNELDASGDSIYTINRDDFVRPDNDTTLNGIYGCATVVDGKVQQLVSLYNVVVKSDLKVDEKQEVKVALGQKGEIKLNATTDYKGKILYSWTKDYEEVNCTSDTYTIDTVTGEDLGEYMVMVYDGVKIKFVTINVVADETKLPTVGYATGIKTAARGVYSVKLAWNKAQNATGYVVYKAVSGKWKRIGVTAGTSYLVTGLAAADKEAFAIKPYRNHFGKIVYAKKHTSYATFTKPANVRTFITPVRAYTAVKANWTKSTRATGYVVYRKVGTKWVRLGTTKTNSYVFKNLKRNTSYNIAVRPYVIVDGQVAYSPANIFGTIRTLK
ncbi:MAG: fibronectin type III domain-containing protein [Lachnospiraceae bacterium]|nr:fibronectin type III domain-containing protein [Lachnospiraceae bacterium]